ncbi:polymorphic toxin-type HINT domain-containing protein [Spirillospora sp. CA-294931]|uniref:polymorphic toxin-type HINT domain-containing protein n=1 Tax=Spirillospora sp. CA-294931 TaxID=3240042 RepID=UPI003D8A2B45
MTTDSKTGKTSKQPVVASYSGTRYNSIVRITISADEKRDGRRGEIRATEHHLFWDASTSEWNAAGELATGSRLRSPNGDTIEVANAVASGGGGTVYDITVARTHAFYVSVANSDVLVHNCSPELARHAAQLPTDSGIQVVSLLRTRLGRRYFGHNMNREDIGDVDFDARQAIDAAGGHHRGCAEIGCISDAFEAEDSVDGAVMETVLSALGTSLHLSPHEGL